jgi:hypothetical protein
MTSLPKEFCIRACEERPRLKNGAQAARTAFSATSALHFWSVAYTLIGWKNEHSPCRGGVPGTMKRCRASKKFDAPQKFG